MCEEQREDTKCFPDHKTSHSQEASLARHPAPQTLLHTIAALRRHKHSSKALEGLVLVSAFFSEQREVIYHKTGFNSDALVLRSYHHVLRDLCHLSAEHNCAWACLNFNGGSCGNKGDGSPYSIDDSLFHQPLPP